MGGQRWSELGKSSDPLCKWSEHSIEVHGIKPEDVAGARDHVAVLESFLCWAVEAAKKEAEGRGLDPSAIELAFNCHNGSACDLDWLYHYRRRYNLKIPPEFKYYFDTLTIVKSSVAHPFNKGGYKGPVPLEGLYSLGNLYEAVFGERYDGEHDAGADAEAGAKLLSHMVSV